MKSIRTPLYELETFDTLYHFLQGAENCALLQDLSDSVRPHLTDALGREFTCRVIVTYADLRAKELVNELSFYDPKVVFFPAKDLIFYQADIRFGEIIRERMKCIRRILEGGRLTVVTTFAALMAPQISPEAIKCAVLKIDKTKSVDEKKMAEQLVRMGYERVPQVEAPGQFSIRGDIVDVFDLTTDNPYRIELWGDEVESVRIFDVATQRSMEELAEAHIFPATEMVISEDELREGFRRIQAEGKKRVASLYKELKTAEAHRLETTIAAMEEQVFELGIQLNLDSYIRYFVQEASSFIDLFPAGKTCIFMDEPARILEHADAVEFEFSESMTHRAEQGYVLPGQMALLFSRKQVAAKLAVRRRLLFESIRGNAAEELFPEEKIRNFRIEARSIAPYNNSFSSLVSDLKKYKREKYRVLILSGSRTRAKRLVEDLRDNGAESFYSEDPGRELQAGEIEIYYGNIRNGFEYPEIKLAVISESDIFTAARKHKQKKKKYAGGERIGSFSDLKVGDYVVHEEYGLGIYRGVDQVEVDKVRRDYLRIEYAEGSSLYIAATALSLIQKYAAGASDGEGRKPKLNKIGGTQWQQTKAKVQTAVEEVAQDLVELYAKRTRTQGFAFEKDTVWQQEFEEAFPYEETDDQIEAIKEVKQDMESTQIMDRLICGDVGFGKTEIAIRAAFKAVQDGKQVAVLVPTTILAGQHFNTFSARFSSFPVRVDMLSRFRTAGEIKRTLADLQAGQVDIVIGTHRLLSKDVVFKDLGLLVIDEEQRFGVTHKEKIKKLKEQVDVLTLTATPIPRTLHMSLIGIRSVSMLEEAPLDRLPIQTFVCEYNPESVREAIMRELARHGQVYYVYNRVNTIADVAVRVQALVPEARVAFAHGQMHEAELEKIMYDFVGGQIDVLISTTIIETGMDIPNVNTIIVEDSDRFGLSQLYQLRGRVGRSARTAYAFLMYKRDRVLQEVAQKRLDAIREFTDLGSGYKISMRDLEIRGAGNLLGTRQSGHMAEVGYEMYCRMLEEAISKYKGEPIEQTAHLTTSVELNVDAYIPGTYILNEEQKLEIYKRIAAFTDDSEGDEMRDELLDRFGEVPDCVLNLIRVSGIRMRAQKLYVTEIKNSFGVISLHILPSAPLNPTQLPALLKSYRGRLRFHTGVKPEITYHFRQLAGTVRTSDELLADTEMILTDMETAFIAIQEPPVHKEFSTAQNQTGTFGNQKEKPRAVIKERK